ncbi:MAG: hypothetical protein H0T54_01715 [Geodermatophilaceae bacterium]|nr:hypothetical protein [Geodermatophilaceae bacterium]
MIRPAPVIALALLVVTTAVEAQQIVLRDAGSGRAAAVVQEILASPHQTIGGRGPLVLPRDSSITGTLVVLGRPTYVASKVQGDVVVINGDLFLRPGAEVSGRAIAVGGTVATSSLVHVGGGTESIRDASYQIQTEGSGYSLTYQDLRAGPSSTRVELAGVKGLIIPSYDRVNGLSLPVGGRFVASNVGLEVEPALTYRSRLGAVDPSVDLRLVRSDSLRLVARIARDTRTNDGWIYGNLVNSALFFIGGADARNYFRSNIGEARAIARLETPTMVVEPFLGGRYERVSPISAAGNVFTIRNRRDIEKGARPNPLVEDVTISSLLGGATLGYEAAPVTGRLAATVEQSTSVSTGASSFTQLTMHGHVQFPTFSTQTLSIRGHAVASRGGNVPKARYAYLGGSGTLPLLDLLERGGDQLFFVEGRYAIPIERFMFPLVGSPTVTLRDIIGGAGVHSISRVEHEVGIGIGVSFIHVEVTTDARGERGTKYGVGISLGK